MGSKFKSFKVENWFDCGRKETLLESNATLLKTLGADKAAFCTQMSAEGLRGAVKLVSVIFGFAGLVYLWTSKTLHKDMVARMN